jgi:hypothetical protein
MTHPSKLHTLTALSLACAMIAGCGGGDAEAPPPPPSSGPVVPPPAGPDTTAPTVTVADNISVATASGPVTFTFVFSEDVGISFGADDIVVTGGTAGAFTRVSGAQATLVVTPTANATGTMGVSVAASRFTDLQGNSNTATASGQQAYDTVVPAVPGNTGTCLAANCVDFSAAGITFSPFENPAGGTVGIVNDPINAANKVVRFVKKPGDGDFFGTVIGGFSAPIVLTSTNKTITLRVWSPTAGTNFLLKLEGGAGGASTERDVVTTLAGQWETLTFVMPTAGTYTTFVLFPNGRSSVSADKTMYIDELKFPAVATGGGGSSTALLTFDETTAPTLTPFGVNGAGPTIVTDPAGGPNKVLRVAKFTGSEQWAGVTVSTGAAESIPAIPFTATAQTITMRVLSPAVGVRVRMKVENAANNNISVETDAITTTSGTWETLTFNFANPGTNPPVGGGPTSALNLTQTYNKLSVFSDFGIGVGGSGPLPADRIYYYDDITFVGAPSGGGGGGGGGGSASTLVFSSGFAAGNRTVEGGEFGGFSGSNQDNYQCNGQPASCGSGGDITPAVAAADSFFFYYYQTPTPAADLYMGIYVLAPGLTGGLSNTGDSPGIQINGQTSISFKLGQNAEWFSTSTRNFAVDLTLGKRYVVGGNTCRVQLRKIVTPTASAATAYTVALSSFSVVQDCAQSSLTLAAALAGSPISQVSFQGAGGGIPLSAGGLQSGANLSVAAGGVYPTTLVLAGGVRFAP